jgi:hypothetical protein
MSHSSNYLLLAKELQIKKSLHSSCVDPTRLSYHQRQLIKVTFTKRCHSADSPHVPSSLHITMVPLLTTV